MSGPVQTVRRWFVKPRHARRVALHGRQMIVTGCAPRSIGYETARVLAAWGADVVVTTRQNPEAVAASLRQCVAAVPEHGRIDAQPLDLADAASVEHFVRWYRSTYGERLDVLVNNAGIHLDLLSRWKQPRLSADGHEIHWRTNYLGTQHLSRRLLPLLLQAAADHGSARVVNLVSELHRKGRNADLLAPPARYNSWVAYGNSKLALMHATFELQHRHAQRHGLQAYCLHPGAVFSNIADRGLAGHPRLERLRRACGPIEAFFLLTPEEGAQTTLHCATHAHALGGHYYRNCAVAPLSHASGDMRVSARLWDQTEAWLEGLQPDST